jgi:hypothetical protein
MSDNNNESIDVDLPTEGKFEELLEVLAENMGNNTSPVRNMLSNVFSMRIIGNKTHGDLAEIAITSYINEHLSNFKATHVGKEKFRAKSDEEDVQVEAKDGTSFPISLKAYGNGPLQLSTNKDGSMFDLLESKLDSQSTSNEEIINSIIKSRTFEDFQDVNVLPLIYDESEMMFNIMIYDIERAYESTNEIRYIGPGTRGRKHPVYRFYDEDDDYILEVRYGGAGANALQRGMWTKTTWAEKYFNSITGGWIEYNVNQDILDLISAALVKSPGRHQAALNVLLED